MKTDEGEELAGEEWLSAQPCKAGQWTSKHVIYRPSTQYLTVTFMKHKITAVRTYKLAFFSFEHLGLIQINFIF